jgi:hypothetical protein
MKSFNEAINESSSTVSSLVKHIKAGMEKIDDSMSYKDFAAAVAKIMEDDYGDRNYGPFLEELKKLL